MPTHLVALEIPLSTLTCEDLILFKLVAGRLIDRADAALMRYNKPTLDLKHLARWVARLGLSAAWNEVWQEAFPGEAAPAPKDDSP